MEVSGFTFIKNGLNLGYPIKESIQSIEPLCDEIIINIGFDDPELKKDDGTEEYLKTHFSGPKYKFVKSWWDPALRVGGKILAEQTNIALSHCQGDLCQYIQGDEALHEKDVPTIKRGYEELMARDDLQGLIFKYLHFYGNVDVYKYTRNIYRREVRTIKNGLGIQSWKDAQGFRFSNETKLNAKMIDATVYHYGWARKETIMKEKVKEMDKLYRLGEIGSKTPFAFERIYGLHPFKGTHPKVVEQWVKENKNDIDLLKLKPNYKLKNINHFLCDLVEGLTNYRIGEYKNYKMKK